MSKNRLRWLAVPLICCLVAVFAFGMVALPQASATGEATAERSIGPDSISPEGATQISVTITAAETLNGFILDEDPPSGWTVEGVENDGATFKEAEVKWLWTETLAVGESKTVTYNLTAPEGAAADDYALSGVLKSLGIDIAVTGENTITVAPPAEFTLDNLVVEPISGVAPLLIDVSADVTNSGGVSGDCTAELRWMAQWLTARRSPLLPEPLRPLPSAIHSAMQEPIR